MLSGSIWSGIYRTAVTDLTNSERPIMHNVCNFSNDDFVTLTAGTYWIDYSCEGYILSGPWQPYVTIWGEPITGNALHFGASGWVPMTDENPDNTQGMPFKVYGSVVADVKNINNIKTNIYPNPTSDFLNIDVSNSYMAEYKLINTLGTVMAQGFFNQKTTISIANFSSGFYILKLNIENDIYDIKVIKK